jgi:hypothetical protein
LQLSEFLIDALNLLVHFAQPCPELFGLWAIRPLRKAAVHIARLFLKLLALLRKLSHSWVGLRPLSFSLLLVVPLHIVKLSLDTAHLLADYLHLGLDLAGFLVSAGG